MDGICDSVDTVKQTKKLTQDIDKLLESGWFAVEKWTSNKAQKRRTSKEDLKPPRKKEKEEF